MRVYFGRVTDPNLIEDSFQHNGSYFEYFLELGEEDVKLVDTCDRMVPIFIGHWSEFVTAVIKADTTYAPLAKGFEALERIKSDKETFV